MSGSKPVAVCEWQQTGQTRKAADKCAASLNWLTVAPTCSVALRRRRLEFGRSWGLGEDGGRSPSPNMGLTTPAGCRSKNAVNGDTPSGGTPGVVLWRNSWC